MSEIDDTNEKPQLQFSSMDELAHSINTHTPNFVIVSDSHYTPQPQILAADLISRIVDDTQSPERNVGFYVEALYSDQGDNDDFNGAVIQHDAQGKTRYSETIHQVQNRGVKVSGIDTREPVDSESEERINHWVDQISKGNEAVKILLIGSGHIWNDSQNPSDLIHRLTGKVWVILNEHAYVPPNYSQIYKAHISRSTTYKVVEYSRTET